MVESSETTRNLTPTKFYVHVSFRFVLHGVKNYKIGFIKICNIPSL